MSSQRLVVPENSPRSIGLLESERLKRHDLGLSVLRDIVRVNVLIDAHWLDDSRWITEIETGDVGWHPVELESSYSILLVIGPDLIESYRAVYSVNTLYDSLVIIPREDPVLQNCS